MSFLPDNISMTLIILHQF